MFYKLALPWINTWWCGRGAEGRKFPLWNAVEFVCRQQNKGWIIKVHHPLPILWAKGQVSLDAFECLAVSSPGWHPPLEWVPGSHSPGAGTSAVASLSLHNPLQAKQRWESREMVWILHKSKVSLVPRKQPRNEQSHIISDSWLYQKTHVVSEIKIIMVLLPSKQNILSKNKKLSKELQLNRMYSQFQILLTHSPLFCFYWFCLRSLWKGDKRVITEVEKDRLLAGMKPSLSQNNIWGLKSK